MPAADDQPRLPRFLWAVTLTECAVVAWAAVLMFVFPALGRRIWAYSFPPFNSRYVGAVYFAALAPLLIVAVSGRWIPGRLVLRMVLTFTVTILIVMLFYTGSFAWGRVQTYGFWGLYIVLPVNTAVYLHRYRRTPRAPSAADPLVKGSAALAAIYGLGLLVDPRTFTSFWPWPVDAFQGRMYAAAFLASAVGLWSATPAGRPSERTAVGAWLSVLGGLAIIGMLIEDAVAPAGHGVDFARAGTWAFIALNAALALIGARFVSSRGRAVGRPRGART
jgi:hypothetical protein